LRKPSSTPPPSKEFQKAVLTNLVAFEMFPGERSWRLLGEWP
jgi:hypothetical protein